MAINLTKGGSINLAKADPALQTLRLGLGWDVTSNQPPMDIDCCAFICHYNAQQEPKLISDTHFVFYNNLSCPQGAVVHQGDNRTGDGANDDEVINIALNKVIASAQEISLFVTIHNQDGRGFGKVNNCYIKLYNDQTSTLIAEYNLTNEFSNETALQVGSLVKENGQWVFHAVGAGYQLGLGDIVAGYQ